jgi:hypothetical protein
MSSERNGARGEAAAEPAGGQLVEGAPSQPEPGEIGSPAAEEPPHDSWFEPARRPDPGTGDASEEQNGLHDTGWFLRTGRAGLLPDSMTESWENDGSQDNGGRHARVQPQAAGAPPWAGEQPGPVRDTPPPWESGPWPGPGEARPAARDGGASAGRALAEMTGARATGAAGAWPVMPAGNWEASASVVAGIVPLLVPGLALGALGLRRARVTGTGKIASWLGIGLSLVSAIVLAVFLMTAGGQSGTTCAANADGVGHPVAQVLQAMSDGAPDSVLLADLRQAIGQANAAAAAAQQVTVRNALSSVTNGLQTALVTVQARHGGKASQLATVQQQLTADMAGVTSACAS